MHLRELGRAEKIGMDLLGDDRRRRWYGRLWVRRLAVMAVDVDAEAAAIWISRRMHRSSSPTFVCMYAKESKGWRPVSGHEVTVESGFPRARRSVAMTGPASILSLEDSGGLRCGSPPDSPWIGYQIIQVASEVSHLQVGDRELAIPDHGYVIVVWKTAEYGNGSYGRPPIAAYASDGSCLTSLGTYDYVDSAVWDSSL
jgi:hypothetical protein